MAYSRKKSREIVFRMLFHLTFTAPEAQEVLALACEDELPTGLELEYINNLYTVACENLDTIDQIITETAHGFTIDRMYKTDLTALRLGIAEIKYTPVQPTVVINEAVEIAKKYGMEKSAAFVNGILAKVVI